MHKATTSRRGLVASAGALRVLGFRGLGFRGLGFRVYKVYGFRGLGFRVWGLRVGLFFLEFARIVSGVYRMRGWKGKWKVLLRV